MILSESLLMEQAMLTFLLSILADDYGVFARGFPLGRVLLMIFAVLVTALLLIVAAPVHPLGMTSSMVELIVVTSIDVLPSDQLVVVVFPLIVGVLVDCELPDGRVDVDGSVGGAPGDGTPATMSFVPHLPTSWSTDRMLVPRIIQVLAARDGLRYERLTPVREPHARTSHQSAALPITAALDDLMNQVMMLMMSRFAYNVRGCTLRRPVAMQVANLTVSSLLIFVSHPPSQAQSGWVTAKRSADPDAPSGLEVDADGLAVDPVEVVGGAMSGPVACDRNDLVHEPSAGHLSGQPVGRQEFEPYVEWKGDVSAVDRLKGTLQGMGGRWSVSPWNDPAGWRSPLNRLMCTHLHGWVPYEGLIVMFHGDRHGLPVGGDSDVDRDALGFDSHNVGAARDVLVANPLSFRSGLHLNQLAPSGLRWRCPSC
ncbi:hypothetical protein BDK51DRAFT_48086 [Blyttiomyces helicus]|uniref:Uncharacterized protein n=1 Tax=Blyttiomyces helicus TaxID=388810 RepID=A0A4P9WMY7_9FUNG|nr:hypothetical protein BDK51DRAFT_48086 [Blyttiomyces helicus]|eukprot:RKO94461.1 hypothetical protein BDK51DRAFT_48086 [Blyttiomyces helicus]